MNRKNNKRILFTALLFIVIILGYRGIKKWNLNPNYEVGQAIDSLNNVIVYYNGGVGHVEGRTVIDGYNIGLKYQCVEFVKRYYFLHYNHRMPDAYGHAKSFFAEGIGDGQRNIQRGLYQYVNPSKSSPKIGDLIVMDGELFNKYGHVAIVANVAEDHIEIIQQNPGPFGSSREEIPLLRESEKWKIDQSNILGWLRK